MSDSFKKWATWVICSRLLITSERCERIAHGRSFLVSNLITSLIFGERPEQFAHIAERKWAMVSESLTSLTKKEDMSENEQFTHFSINFLKIVYKIYLKQDFRFFSQNFCAKRSFAHLLWATWANYSGSLICLEGSEQMAHSHSLIWAKWANERWANEQIPSTA